MRLHTQTAGSGPDLILLHGWGLHSGVWSTTATELQQEFRVTRVDLPGHGGSPADIDISDLDELCKLFRMQLPNKAIWVGWSMGGLIAMAQALRFSEAVDRVVVVAGSPCFCHKHDWEFGVASDTLREFADALAENPGEVLRRFLALQVTADSRGRATLRTMRIMASEYSPTIGTLAKGLTLLEKTDLRSELDTIATMGIPLRFILGARDRLIDPQTGVRMDRELKNCSVKLLEGCGHAPFLDDSVGFLQALSASLND